MNMPFIPVEPKIYCKDPRISSVILDYYHDIILTFKFPRYFRVDGYYIH